MNSQLYTAASGLLVEERRVEAIANNLANLSTPGFRALRAFSTVYEGVAAGAPPGVRAANRAVALAGNYEVPGPGPLRPTGRALDLALGGEAVLAVETPAGRRYTRAGDLEVSPKGELTDRLGHPVLDQSGQPLGGLTLAAEITVDGRVVEGQEERGRLMLLHDAERVLEPEGDNLLTARGLDAKLEPIETPDVRSGWLEGSATQALEEMVLLVEAQRAFEGYQRMIHLTMNEVNRRAVNDIAG